AGALCDDNRTTRLQQAYDCLAVEIMKAYPGNTVKLVMVGDKIVVGGQAKDSHDAKRILEIVRANAAPPISPCNYAGPVPLPICRPPSVPDNVIDLLVVSQAAFDTANAGQVSVDTYLVNVDERVLDKLGFHFNIHLRPSQPGDEMPTNNAGLLGFRQQAT